MHEKVTVAGRQSDRHCDKNWRNGPFGSSAKLFGAFSFQEKYRYVISDNIVRPPAPAIDRSEHAMMNDEH